MPGVAMCAPAGLLDLLLRFVLRVSMRWVRPGTQFVLLMTWYALVVCVESRLWQDLWVGQPSNDQNEHIGSSLCLITFSW